MIGIEPNLLYDLFLNYDKYANELSLLTESFWLNTFPYIVAILFSVVIFSFLSVSFWAIIASRSGIALLGIIMAFPLVFVPLKIYEITQNKLYENALENVKINKNDWEVIKHYQTYYPDFRQKYLASFEKEKTTYDKLYQSHIPLKIEFNQKEDIKIKLDRTRDIFNSSEFEERKQKTQQHIDNISKILNQEENQKLKQQLNQCLDTQTINNQKFDYDNAGIWICFNTKIINNIDENENN